MHISNSSRIQLSRPEIDLSKRELFAGSRFGTHLRVAIVSYRPPSSQGYDGGGGLAVYGMAAAISAVGHDVHFVITDNFCESKKRSCEFECHFLKAWNEGEDVRSHYLSKFLRKLVPDVVWIYHTKTWPIFSPLRNKYPHILYSVDPEWQVELLRRHWREPPRSLVRKVFYALVNYRRDLLLRKKERDAFQQAAEFGVTAGYTASEVVGMSRRSGVNVEPCTLAYPAWKQRSSRLAHGIPRALLLGNLNSVHTRFGLRYFFDEIWPFWKEHEASQRCEIRVVGGGQLPRHFVHPTDDPRIRWIGFVPSLIEEWESASALLVPVPLQHGIRSRIVESWCRGVPVIAHPGAENGLPMMKAGENYLAAKKGEEWVSSILALINNLQLATSIARNGRKAFEREFTSKAGAERFDQLAGLAIERFKSRKSFSLQH